MHTIWYENKALVFAAQSDDNHLPCLSADDSAMTNPAKLLQKFDNSNTLYIMASNPTAAFERFTADMTHATAAGGLVENAYGQALLMFRRGWWDLPKGHVERGETHEEAALREVEEETGLHGVRIISPITSTYHFYRMHGRWEIKCTYWYRMAYDGTERPVPQTEEGIEEIRWVEGNELRHLTEDTFGTIREVFGHCPGYY